jgi:predicted outer membrane protein
MRLRPATLALAALTLLGVSACGDDSDDRPPPAPTPAVSTSQAAGIAPGASAAPGATIDPSAEATEGTSVTKPPKKGGRPAQEPAGKTTAAP